MKVYISPSSQNHNLYEGADTTEAKTCWEIGTYVHSLLSQLGHESAMPDNNQQTYQERVRQSNEYNPDVHLCIHTNAGGGDGTVVFCHPKNVDNEIVNRVYHEVAVASPGEDDGIRAMTNLYEINKTKALCVYVECEFHDRSDLANWIVNNTYTLAKAIVRGLTSQNAAVATDPTFKPQGPLVEEGRVDHCNCECGHHDK